MLLVFSVALTDVMKMDGGLQVCLTRRPPSTLKLLDHSRAGTAAGSLSVIYKR